MWNASEQDFRSFENGDYVRVEGSTQLFQGSIQLIATGIRRADPNAVNLEDFQNLDAKLIDQLVARLSAHLRKIANPYLHTLGECFLGDDTFMRRFCQAPAGVKNHHAYLGGLLEHVVGLMDLVRRIDGLYPALDNDLLLISAFLRSFREVRQLLKMFLQEQSAMAHG